jgi:hypothetical protein
VTSQKLSKPNFSLKAIVFKPLQSTGTIVSKQINFVNVIYDSETKLTGTILRPQPILTTISVNLISVDPIFWETVNISTTQT